MKIWINYHNIELKRSWSQENEPMKTTSIAKMHQKKKNTVNCSMELQRYYVF